jgi:hypothetical protein
MYGGDGVYLLVDPRLCAEHSSFLGVVDILLITFILEVFGKQMWW